MLSPKSFLPRQCFSVQGFASRCFLLFAATALSVSIAAVSIAAVSMAAEPSDYARLRAGRYIGPVAVPEGGVQLLYDTAFWRFDEGEFWFLEPLEGGAITGVVFEGKGRFELRVPDARERRQLKRFAENPELEEIQQDFDRLALRSTLREVTDTFGSLADQIPNPVAERQQIAAHREHAWLRYFGHDASARTISALRNLGSRYMRASMRTAELSWLEYDLDDLRSEEVRLQTFQIRANTLRLMPFPTVETWVSLDRQEQRQDTGEPSGNPNPALRLQHISSKIDLTKLGRAPAVSLSRTHPMNAVAELKSRYQSQRDGVAALRLALGPGAVLARVRDSRGEELEFLRYNVGEHDAQLDDRLHHSEMVVLLKEPLALGATVEVTFDFELELFGYAGGLSWYPIPVGTDFEPHTALTEIVHRAKYTISGVGRRERKESGKRATTTLTVDEPRLMAGFSWAKKAHERIYQEEGLPTVTMFGSTSGFMSERRVEIRGELVVDALRYFTKQFDRQLETDEVSIAFTAAKHGQAFGTYIQLPEWSVIDGIGEREEFFIAHEVAHLWWGHNTGWSTYRDYWLIESLAEYSALMFLKDWHEDGERIETLALQAYTDEINGSLKSWYGAFARPAATLLNQSGADRLAPLSHGERSRISEAPSGTGSVMYRKGMLVLHMIRRQAQAQSGNDDLFLQVLRDYHDLGHKGRAKNADFFDVVGEHIQGDWRRFFDQWVDSAEVPTLRFDHEIDRTKEGQWRLQIEVSSSDAPVGFVSEVPVLVSFADAPDEEHWISASVGESSVREFTFERQPTELRFNHEFGSLARMRRSARAAKKLSSRRLAELP